MSEDKRLKGYVFPKITLDDIDDVFDTKTLSQSQRSQ